MSRAWALFRAHPYVGNMLGYTTLFASADIIQQSVLGGRSPAIAVPQSGDSPRAESRTVGIDWSQTAKVALVGFCFHANFNYNWLRGLERLLPGGGFRKITLKVGLDQLIAAPVTISAFFIGLSILERKEDPLEDWRGKFWTSYKTGVVFWTTMQAINFALVPPVARTVFVGGISLVWTVFLCHLRHQRSTSTSQ